MLKLTDQSVTCMASLAFTSGWPPFFIDINPLKFIGPTGTL